MNKLYTAVLALLGTFLSSPAFAHGMSEADKQKILDAGYWEYVELGTTHMLTGYDHLLFLFGVMFFLTRFMDILKFITVFTIGHSITLVFATLLHIQANYFLIDAVIALTVCYKGFDNIDGFKKYFDVKAPNLVNMVFIFGLIHGFGLSTRLQQLPLPEGEGLVGRILAFNVGVEAGQVIALTIMLLLLAGWRKRPSFTKFSNAANVGLIIVGALLLLMQLHGYEHTSHPDDYPLNKDDHHHVHEDMEAAKPSLLEGQEPKFDLSSEEPPAEPAAESEEEPTRHTHDGEHYHVH